MTQTLSDRLKEQQRLAAEIDQELASFHNAQQAAE